MKLLTQTTFAANQPISAHKWQEWPVDLVTIENRKDVATQAAIVALAEAGHLRLCADGAHRATETFPDCGISVWVHIVTPKTPRWPTGIPHWCHTLEVQFGPGINEIRRYERHETYAGTVDIHTREKCDIAKATGGKV